MTSPGETWSRKVLGRQPRHDYTSPAQPQQRTYYIVRGTGRTGSRITHHGYSSATRQQTRRRPLASIEAYHKPPHTQCQHLDPLAMATHPPRSLPARHLPRHPSPRLSLQHLQQLDKKRAIQPHPAITSPKSRPKLLCQKIQHLQRLLCEDRLVLDDGRLLRLHLQPLLAGPALLAHPHAAPHPRRRALLSSHGRLVRRHAMVLRRAPHRPRF